MALLNVSFRSQSLNHDTFINVILPENGPAEDIPTLYLLHGMHGNHSSWVRKTNIERFAQENKLAVVMPEGENSFYADMKYGKKYFTYVADELTAFTRRMFRLSEKREKTFIAGLSMGGYGAIKIALRRPERYAAAASLSGTVDIVSHVLTCKWTAEAAAIWGDDFKSSIAGTDSDIFTLVRKYPANLPHPRIYAACGKQDPLYAENLSFKALMESEAGNSFDFLFEDGDGIHNWEFWDKWIVPATEWMMRSLPKEEF
ncbi:MAG: esterase family protein [Clostridia bacterium]|nr:esterase family protein [Clostridia bacterium]